MRGRVLCVTAPFVGRALTAAEPVPHRLKTHGDWTYHRDRTRSYRRTSPLGRINTVTHAGTSAAD